MYTLNFDGLFRGTEENSGPFGNSGIMCYGWLIYEDQRVIAKGHGSYINRKVASSNGAEYLALIEGLEALKDMGLKNEAILIVGDAKSVIDQMQGLAEVSSIRIKALHRKARRLSQKMAGLQWFWVPRNENKAADLLTRHALRQMNWTNIESHNPMDKTKRSSGFQLISDFMVCQRPQVLINF